MWKYLLGAIVVALFVVYVRFVVVKYPQMDEPARRKFIYVVGAGAFLLLVTDFIVNR
jgi:hypothetical protein